MIKARIKFSPIFLFPFSKIKIEFRNYFRVLNLKKVLEINSVF